MRIAIIKLGSRISISSHDSSGGTGETLAIIRMLLKAGVEVSAFTKILKKDETPKDFKILDLIENIDSINKDNYDALLVLNGNVNYFGGEDEPYQTLNYKAINKFNGKVFYIHCDGNLYLRQIWPSIEKKYWHNNYNEEDIKIVRDDIIYLTQSRNTSLVIERANKNGVKINKAFYFPLEKFPLISNDDNYIIPYNFYPKYDLLYGGTFRNGRRQSDMIKFYFGYDPEKYNVTMFGKINIDNFDKNKINGLEYPFFEKGVNYNKFKDKMSESLATVIIGDEIYKKQDDLAQRIYESALSGSFVLIDSSYDFNKRVFNNPILKQFCYVNNREDVKNRLFDLKFYRKYYRDLLLEDLVFNFNEKQYCDDFINLIGENI